jgi:hypothetical protein
VNYTGDKLAQGMHAFICTMHYQQHHQDYLQRTTLEMIYGAGTPQAGLHNFLLKRSHPTLSPMLSCTLEIIWMILAVQIQIAFWATPEI